MLAPVERAVAPDHPMSVRSARSGRPSGTSTGIERRARITSGRPAWTTSKSTDDETSTRGGVLGEEPEEVVADRAGAERIGGHLHEDGVLARSSYTGASVCAFS